MVNTAGKDGIINLVLNKMVKTPNGNSGTMVSKPQMENPVSTGPTLLSILNNISLECRLGRRMGNR
jgi:hypothetical protein